MKVELQNPPWSDALPSQTAIEGFSLLDGIWANAAADFYAKVMAERATKGPKAGPKGVQSFLNHLIDLKFTEAGWEGVDGRFRKGKTWIRITFRHQMSCGSDFLDAIRLWSVGGVEECFILAADSKFLAVITPNDAAALTSFEKLLVQQNQLVGVTRSLIFVGRLVPISVPTPKIQALLNAPRSRN